MGFVLMIFMSSGERKETQMMSVKGKMSEKPSQTTWPLASVPTYEQGFNRKNKREGCAKWKKQHPEGREE